MPEELGIPRQIRYRPREFSTGSLPNYFSDHGIRKASLETQLQPSTSNPKIVKGKLTQLESNLTNAKCLLNRPLFSVEKKLSRPLPATPPPISASDSMIKELKRFPWFQKVSRNEAEIAVATKAVNGQFLVRPSVHGGKDSPLTLTIHFEKRIYHLNIRLFPNGKCSLGKKKTNEVVRTLFMSYKDQRLVG